MIDLRVVEMEGESVSWDYDRLYTKIASYVLEAEPVRAPLLFDALSRREGRDVQTGLSNREWDWLQWNLGFLKRVVKTPLMATMIFLAHRSASASFYTRDLARRTGYLEPQVCRYARELESKGLLRRHHVQYDKRVYYLACRDLPVVNKILVELVVTHHGLGFFENLLRPTEAKALKHAQYRRKHAEVASKSKQRHQRSWL